MGWVALYLYLAGWFVWIAYMDMNYKHDAERTAAVPGTEYQVISALFWPIIMGGAMVYKFWRWVRAGGSR